MPQHGYEVSKPLNHSFVRLAVYDVDRRPHAPTFIAHLMRHFSSMVEARCTSGSGGEIALCRYTYLLSALSLLSFFHFLISL